MRIRADPKHWFARQKVVKEAPVLQASGVVSQGQARSAEVR